MNMSQNQITSLQASDWIKNRNEYLEDIESVFEKSADLFVKKNIYLIIEFFVNQPELLDNNINIYNHQEFANVGTIYSKEFINFCTLIGYICYGIVYTEFNHLNIDTISIL